MGNKCFGDIILSFGDFKAILQDFSDCVEAKIYSKMEYNMWRKLVKYRPEESEVVVSWNDGGIEIVFEDEYEVHFFSTEEGFGKFIYEDYAKREWKYDEWYQDYDGTVKYYENAFGEKIAYVKKAAIDAGEKIRNIDLNPAGISLHMDTKVDKSEFEARIQEINDKINNNLMKDEEKNMKGFNFDFGPMNGNVVRMSMYGLAVKNKVGTYVSYNAKSGEIMDVDIFNFDGASFLYKMPVAIKDIAVGDIVIHQNVPMFVVGISEDQKGLVVVDPVCGERKEIMVPRSPFGFNFATKVVNFLGDMFAGGANSDNPFGNMWMLMAMQGDNDMSAVLPMMMMTQGNVDPTMAMVMMAMGQGNGKMDMSSMMPLMWVMQNSKPVAPVVNHTCGGNCNGNCGHHEG